MGKTDGELRVDAARHMLLLGLVTDLYAQSALRQRDPLEFLREREADFKAATDDMALNARGGTEPDELLKHQILHEYEMFFSRVQAAVRRALPGG